MGKPYSNDLRERILAALDEGQAVDAVAVLFKVSARTIGRYVSLRRRSGSVCGKKFGGYKQPLLSAHAARVKALLEAEPDQTLDEFVVRLAAEEIRVSRTSLYRFLQASKLTYKKNADCD